MVFHWQQVFNKTWWDTFQFIVSEAPLPLDHNPLLQVESGRGYT